MNSVETSNTAPVALYRTYGDPKTLAVSLRMSASYIERCAEKRDVPVATNRLYENAKQCERIACDMEQLKANNPALIHFRNTLYCLDAAQIEAFTDIIIDYQARIGSEFVPVSTNHYLADLTAIVFALAAIEDPACLIGVGGGFAPRYRKRDDTPARANNVIAFRAEGETL